MGGWRTGGLGIEKSAAAMRRFFVERRMKKRRDRKDNAETQRALSCAEKRGEEPCGRRW